MASDTMPTFAGRPPIITKSVNGILTRFYVNIHDAEHLRLKAEHRHARVSAHPDSGGTITQFHHAERRYRQWLEQERLWYEALGLTPPGAVAVDAKDLSPELIALLATKSTSPVSLRVRAYLLKHPDAKTRELRKAFPEASKGSIEVAVYRYRHNLGRQLGTEILVKALLDGRPHTPSALRTRTGLPATRVRSIIGRLRARGVNVVTTRTCRGMFYQLHEIFPEALERVGLTLKEVA